MVLTVLTTGFRRGELLGLRWEDIRWADRRIDLRGQLQNRERVPCKNDSEREVVLYSGLATLLGSRRQAEGYVFLDPAGRPWSNAGPGKGFLSEAYRQAGLRRPGQLWHVLRHTHASILAAGGIRRDVVERLMGHAAKGTTSIYTHLFKDAFDGVEEALDAVFGVNPAPTDCSVTTGTDGALAPA
jgi:integrase